MIRSELWLPEGAPRGLCLAVVADLHDVNTDAVLEALIQRKPTHVMVPGDVVHGPDAAEEGLRFLREAAKRFPTFCSLGNHEFKSGLAIRAAIASTGAVLLDNRFVCMDGLVIGGLSSGFENNVQGRLKKTPMPDLSLLDSFCCADGYRILLSHHPEYFDVLKNHDMDLILSGHAHGGQWRLFGIPIFAPGQGLFPRYTSGFYGGKMFVSRGLSNRTSIPRFGNPEELVFLTGRAEG